MSLGLQFCRFYCTKYYRLNMHTSLTFFWTTSVLVAFKHSYRFLMVLQQVLSQTQVLHYITPLSSFPCNLAHRAENTEKITKKLFSVSVSTLFYMLCSNAPYFTKRRVAKHTYEYDIYIYLY